MKHIPLTQGQFAKVDNEDYERLSKFKWFARWDKDTRSFYAMRNERGSDGKRRTLLMHREIMRAKLGEKVDHENHATLDNRRTNLRVCTNQQNCANRKMGRDNTSGFKGVYWRKDSKKWRALLSDGHGKLHQLGHFSTAIEAASAYDAATLRFNGEFALTNHMLGLLP